MNKQIIRSLGVAFLGWAAAAVPGADAYSTYSPGCAACHGDFRDSPYTSLADGQSWGDDLHDVHRNTMLSGECDACHTTGGRTPVFTNSSNGGNGLAGLSCAGCHGRTEDNTGIGSEGAGLRQHHWNAGVTCSTSCHADSNPAAFTPVGENVLPPFYANPGTGHDNIPTDPCNSDGSEDFVGGSNGLDNDGDEAYDAADSDCSHAWWGATELTGGWYWLEWFEFFNVNFDPWIYHEQHEWLFPFSTDDPADIVFYDDAMQAFWWTSSTVYPFVYRFSDGAWLFYEKGSSNPRWFYNFSTQQWEDW
jgi:hypothetical protein